MKKRYIGYILLLLFLTEGTLLYWLLPTAWQTQFMLVPHVTFVAIVLTSMIRHRHLGLLLGLCFGLLHDIVYESPMIGAHGFSMAIAVYLAGAIAWRIKLNIAFTFFVISLAIVIYDVTVFSLYQLFQVTTFTYTEMLSSHLLVTLLFNLLFAIMIYVPARKWFEAKAVKREDEN